MALFIANHCNYKALQAGLSLSLSLSLSPLSVLLSFNFAILPLPFHCAAILTSHLSWNPNCISSGIRSHSRPDCYSVLTFHFSLSHTRVWNRVAWFCLEQVFVFTLSLL